MSEILQGTTPALTVKIGRNDFLVTNVVKLELCLKNGGCITLKGLDDVFVDAGNNSFTYLFSEAETLALVPNSTLKHQWRFMFANGEIVGTKPMSITVTDLYSTQHMTEA